MTAASPAARFRGSAYQWTFLRLPDKSWSEKRDVGFEAVVEVERLSASFGSEYGGNGLEKAGEWLICWDGLRRHISRCEGPG